MLGGSPLLQFLSCTLLLGQLWPPALLFSFLRMDIAVHTFALGFSFGYHEENNVQFSRLPDSESVPEDNKFIL